MQDFVEARRTLSMAAAQVSPTDQVRANFTSMVNAMLAANETEEAICTELSGAIHTGLSTANWPT